MLVRCNSKVTSNQHHQKASYYNWLVDRCLQFPVVLGWFLVPWDKFTLIPSAKMKDDCTRPLLYTNFVRYRTGFVAALRWRRVGWHVEPSPLLASRLQAVTNPVGVAGANSYPQIDQSNINLFSIRYKRLLNSYRETWWKLSYLRCLDSVYTIHL